MPYKNPKKDRNYEKEYQLQKERGEHDARMERQRARRAVDKRDTGTMTKKSPKRKGKDIAHNKPLSRGGTNKDGYRIADPSKNRAKNLASKRRKKK
jgi:hypothetical protein